MSKIVDDTVENGFLKTLTQTIESEPDDKPLEQNFNMNAKMVDYLKKTYGGRTITGITENKMKTTSLHRQCKSIAQVGGFMPSYWSAISLGNDRTPEGTKVREGWDG